MPTWVSEAVAKSAAATPVIYAAITYAIFHYLDKKASAKAKNAIKIWIKPLDYDKAEVCEAIVETFDRVYSKPLLHWRAFLRSTAVSLFVIAIFLYEDARTGVALDTLKKAIVGTGNPSEDKVVISFLFVGFISNIISDYISVFAVRAWLRSAKSSPMLSLLSGPIVGCYTIAAVYLVRDIPFFLILGRLRELLSDGYFPFGWLRFFIFGVTHQSVLTSHWLFVPALAVYGWLLLFALSVILIRVANFLVIGVNGVQWFLKRGDKHPLDAIGYVAAAIVFVVTCVLIFVGRGA